MSLRMSTVVATAQSFKMECCAACGLELYNNGQSCVSCSRVFCASCHSMKTKLDMSFQNMTTMSASCLSCEKIINIKNGSQYGGTLSKGDNPTTVNKSTAVNNDKIKATPSQSKAEKKAPTKRSYNGQSTRSGWSQDSGQATGSGWNQDSGQAMGSGWSQGSGQATGSGWNQDSGQAMGSGWSQGSGQATGSGWSQGSGQYTKSGWNQDSGQATGSGWNQDSGQAMGSGWSQGSGQATGSGWSQGSGQAVVSGWSQGSGQAMGSGWSQDSGQYTKSGWSQDSGQAKGSRWSQDSGQAMGSGWSQGSGQAMGSGWSQGSGQAMRSGWSQGSGQATRSGWSQDSGQAMGSGWSQDRGQAMRSVQSQDTYHNHCHHHHCHHHTSCKGSDSGNASYYHSHPSVDDSVKDSKTDNKLENTCGDIPFALIMCGVLTPEEIEAELYKKQIRELESKLAFLAGNKPDNDTTKSKHNKNVRRDYTDPSLPMQDTELVDDTGKIGTKTNSDVLRSYITDTEDKTAEGEGYPLEHVSPKQGNEREQESSNATAQMIHEERNSVSTMWPVERNTTAPKRHEEESSTQPEWPVEGHAIKHRSPAEKYTEYDKSPENTIIRNSSTQHIPVVDKKVAQSNHTVGENLTQNNFEIGKNSTQTTTVRNSTAKRPSLSAQAKDQRNIEDSNSSVQDKGQGNIEDSNLSAQDKGQRNIEDSYLSAQAKGQRNIEDSNLSAQDKGQRNIEDSYLSAQDKGQGNIEESNLSAQDKGQRNIEDSNLSAQDKGQRNIEDSNLSAQDKGQRNIENSYLSAQATGQRNIEDSYLSAQAKGQRNIEDSNSSVQAKGQRNIEDSYLSAQAKGQRNIEDSNSSVQAKGQRNIEDSNSSVQAKGQRNIEDSNSSVQATDQRNIEDSNLSDQAKGQRNIEDSYLSAQAKGQRNIDDRYLSAQAKGQRNIEASNSSVQAKGQGKIEDSSLSAEGEGQGNIEDSTTSVQAKGQRNIEDSYLSAQAKGQRNIEDSTTSDQAKGQRNIEDSYLSAQAKGQRNIEDSYLSAQAKGQRNIEASNSSVQAKGQGNIEDSSLSAEGEGQGNIEDSTTSVQAKGQRNIEDSTTSVQAKGRGNIEDSYLSVQVKDQRNIEASTVSVQAKGQGNIEDSNSSVKVKGQRNIEDSNSSVQAKLPGQAKGQRNIEACSVSVQAKGQRNIEDRNSSAQAKGQRNIEDSNSSAQAKGQRNIEDSTTSVQAKDQENNEVSTTPVQAKGQRNIVDSSLSAQAKGQRNIVDSSLSAQTKGQRNVEDGHAKGQRNVEGGHAKGQRNFKDSTTSDEGDGSSTAEKQRNMFFVRHFKEDCSQSSDFKMATRFSQGKNNSIPDMPNSVTEIPSSKRKISNKDLKASKRTTGSSRVQVGIHDLEELERVERVDDGHSSPYVTSIIKSPLEQESCPLLMIITSEVNPFESKPKSNFVSSQNSSDGETSIYRYTERARKLKNVNKGSSNVFTALVLDTNTSTAARAQSTATGAQSTATGAQSTAARTQSKGVAAHSSPGFMGAKPDSTAAVDQPTAVTAPSRSSPFSTSSLRLPKNKTPLSTMLKSQPSSSVIQSTRDSLSNIPQKTSAKNQTVTQPTSRPVLKLRHNDSLSIIAKQFHDGFMRLKQKQSEGKPKCNSCGRSECTGENVQSMSRMIKSARENGFQLQDVSPDGNCMFAAVVDQLLMYGDQRFTSRSFREAAVIWLVDNPYTECGTPRSEFLSEDWYHYIDRMAKDGEWGDHIVLGAIAEVVGCTLRVMSPTEGVPHWTTLEPQGEGSVTNEKHLILGHVGEFHYTSLRPADIKSEEKRTDSPLADIDSPLADIQRQESSHRSAQQTEADQLVDLFNNSHLDEQSDLPVAHFSYLLKTIIPIECLDQAAIFSSQSVLDEIGEDDSITSLKSMGSIDEGVHVPVIDEFVTASSHPQSVVGYSCMIRRDLRVATSDSPSHEYCELELDEGGVCPGNTRLKQQPGNTYFPCPDTLKKVKQKMDKMSTSKQFRLLTLPVPCLEYQSWPSVADSWITRDRYEGWPGEEFIHSVKTDGCLLMSYPHEDRVYGKYEWQFCFGLIEKRIFQEILSRHQKHGYIMFKTLCRQSLVEFSKVEDVLKSIFFFTCERVPSEIWETTPGSCVLYMLDELVKGVGERFVPHYFIPQRNMIGHVSDRELEEMKEQVLMLRSQPLLFLRQVQETVRLKTKGDEIIDNISVDVQNFKQHRSVAKSVLDTFIPASISAAQELIKRKYYKEGYDALSNAYEERLAVATCKDSLSYQTFLNGALSGLDMRSTVWLCAYTDKILNGQLSKSLIRELCSEVPLGKIGDFLPVDIAAGYSETEIPLEFFQVVGKFCVDFAKFLFCIEKVPSALPVLQHAYDLYKLNMEEEFKSGQSADKSASEADYILEVAVGLHHICTRQGNQEYFQSKFSDIRYICEKIKTTEANCTLLWFCYLYNLPNQMAVDQPVMQYYFKKWTHWPYEKSDCVF